MLAIDLTSSNRKLTPNILPCSIHHSGPIPTHKRYWGPSPPDNNGARTTYFRGRKLRGRTVKVPEGYQGYVLEKTENVAPQKPQVPPQSHALEDEDGGDEEEPAGVKVMEQKGNFDEMVVWGHEVVPEAEDEYVKGVGEWIAFAEAVSTHATLHCNSVPAWHGVTLIKLADAYNPRPRVRRLCPTGVNAGRGTREARAMTERHGMKAKSKCMHACTRTAGSSSFYRSLHFT